MSEHYYTQDPKSAHHIGQIEYVFDGRVLRFEVDSGVFSKGRVDYGSDLLIHAVEPFQGKALDLGCGYGAIGIALAYRHPHSDWILSDINERAVGLAQRNIAANGIVNAKAMQSDGFSQLALGYDIIVTNPPLRAGKAHIFTWFEQSLSFLNAGGLLYAVIRKAQGAASAKERLQALFGQCDTIERSAGYHVLRCQKGRLTV